MSLKLNTKYLKDYINSDEMTGIKAQVEAAAESLIIKAVLETIFSDGLNSRQITTRKNLQELKLLLKKSSQIPIFLL